MGNSFIRFVFGLCLMFLVDVKICFANSGNTGLQEQVTLALKYQRGKNTDTAKVILMQVIQELTDKGEINTHVGLSARLHLAEITLKEESDFSSKELLQLVEIGTNQQAWDIVAHAHITLALAHELINNKEKCTWHIEQALFLIEKHQLNEVYPKYAVRRSSIYRVFGINRDSALHYATEAIKYASSEASRDKASAYFLLGAMSRGENDDKAVSYFRNAVSVCKDLGDNTGQASMYINISKIYLKKNQLDSALFYNDMGRSMLHKMRKDSDYLPVSEGINLIRANIYKSLGQMDSAWYYINLTYDDLSKNVSKINTNAKSVLEVEESYLDKKQAEQLRFEQNQKKRAIILFLFASVFIALLSYLYIRLRKANQANQVQAERLAQLDQVKSRFFANVSHELRTPLTLILGPIQTVLKGKELTPKQRKLLTMANKSGQQLHELVNEILNLRKLELDKLETETQETPLHTFFYSYFAQFESLAERKNIAYSFVIAINEGLVGKIDQEKCRQILYNLLSNAFKFTPDSEQINARVWLKDETLQIVISDTGSGIHPDDLPNIFERYFQTNQPNSATEGGTGIGLALCHEYVQLFGGTISVDSKLYEGTRFHIVFPIDVSNNSFVSDTKKRWIH